jgi:predicted dehydrogenase
MMITQLTLILTLALCYSCGVKKSENNISSAKPIRIIQLDPTHSHAAAAQNEQLDSVDSTIYVYAPDKSAIGPYLQQIKSMNSRKENPTHWKEVVYFGHDYLEKMAADKKGNVVVLAGNNRLKINYIEQSIKAGMNVFSDKPMVINQEGFERLKSCYQLAQEKGLILFDMMTERYSLIHRVQRSIMQDSMLFGKLTKGSLTHPAVVESSVHHFYRGGKGTRPAWYFDVLQQGEGVVDVTTHLIDLSFWKTFPEQSIDYQKDIQMVGATHGPVYLSRAEFTAATSLPAIPLSLAAYMKDSTLSVFANGSINYILKGVYTKVEVEWRAATPPGGNDIRKAYAEGTKSTLFIMQQYGQNKPKLCLQKTNSISDQMFNIQLIKSFEKLQKDYPGLSWSEEGKFIQINIPSELELNRDITFQVFSDHLLNHTMPKWEVPNTIAKYFITTSALELAKSNK